jgi:drug/metabolite transporter (DMT)-like permease
MAPATCLAQLMLLIIAAPIALAGGVGLGLTDVLWLALFGAGQIGLGLILLTIGARLIPAAQVALITLLEVVLGPLWVWLAVGERPGAATLIGGAIVVAAVILQARDATATRGARPAELGAAEGEYPPGDLPGPNAQAHLTKTPVDEGNTDPGGHVSPA